jgi:hypothetical protein
MLPKKRRQKKNRQGGGVETLPLAVKNPGWLDLQQSPSGVSAFLGVPPCPPPL